MAFPIGITKQERTMLVMYETRPTAKIAQKEFIKKNIKSTVSKMYMLKDEKVKLVMCLLVVYLPKEQEQISVEEFKQLYDSCLG